MSIDWAGLDTGEEEAEEEEPQFYFGTRKRTRILPDRYEPQTQAQRAYQSRYASGGETGATVRESSADRNRRRAYEAREASRDPLTGKHETGVSKGRASKQTRDVDDARSVSEGYMWIRNAFLRDPDTYQRIADLVERIIGEPPTPQDVEKWWDDAVNGSASYYMQKGRVRVTPEQLLEKWATKADADAGERGTTTSTSRDVNLTDESTIRGRVRETAQGAIGKRYLNDEEEARYISAIQAAERANPSVTTRTSTTDRAGNTTSSSETSGGIDVDTELETKFLAHPEYAEYQAAGYYAPLLFDMLGATVQAPGGGGGL